ncbi:hypothetical protein AURDEDRAFT_176486 [Auricularia subglabra TFB-10046 SS5]|uniref:Uncharacterized protein n=1 Tax=Auricularia subglabra (strain TFB-10046 / SS5) TaxID=717982 RepID=J0LD71_AURST|nr:hypothetical protein AURDEDRAFT_176486 [Auricularia subglabra TFB-10046 SS5]
MDCADDIVDHSGAQPVAHDEEHLSVHSTARPDERVALRVDFAPDLLPPSLEDALPSPTASFPFSHLYDWDSTHTAFPSVHVVNLDSTSRAQRNADARVAALRERVRLCTENDKTRIADTASGAKPGAAPTDRGRRFRELEVPRGEQLITETLCEICLAAHTSVDLATEHVKEHDEGNGNRCLGGCSEFFDSYDALNGHWSENVYCGRSHHLEVMRACVSKVYS